MVKIGITGHRPQRLKQLTTVSKLTDWLDLQFYEHMDADEDFILITGMAQGTDQIAAHEALLFGGRIWCYYPYRRKLHEAEDYLESKADKVMYEQEEYSPQCYIKRDRRIVDDCDVRQKWLLVHSSAAESRNEHSVERSAENELKKQNK